MRRLHTPDDLAGIADEALCEVINQRFTELVAIDDYTFDELAEFWLVEPGDSVEAVGGVTQLPIAHDWLGDVPYGNPDFSPCWEVLEAHPSAYEMVFITNDAGYGIVLWLPKVGTDPTLLAICAEYATPAAPSEDVPITT